MNGERNAIPAQETPRRRLRVFISYARENQIFRERLGAALEALGSETIGDWRLEPGLNFSKQLSDLIRDADAFIFMITPAAVDSSACRDEAAIAERFGKKLLPLLLEDGYNEALLPSAIKIPQWTYLREGDDFNGGVAALDRAIGTDFELMDFHTWLTQRAEEWRGGGRLLDPKHLAQARAWLPKVAQNPLRLPNVSPLHLDYINASERERVRRAWSITTMAVIAALSFLALAYYANDRRLAAVDRAAVAESRRLATLSDRVRSKRLDEALLLSVEAFKWKSTLEARDSLFRSLVSRPEVTMFITNDQRAIPSVAYTPDGHSLVIGCDDRVTIYNVETGRPVRSEVVPRGSVTGLAVSGDGSKLAVTSLAFGRQLLGSVSLLDLPSLNQVDPRPLFSAAGSINAIGFTSDNRALIATGNELVVFDITTKTSGPPLLACPEATITSLACRPDGIAVAVGYRAPGSSGLLLFDLHEDKRVAEEPIKDRSPDCLTFSPDGRSLVAACSRPGPQGTINFGEVLFFDSVSLKPLDTYPLLDSQIVPGHLTTLVFSSDGKTLFAGYAANTGGGAVLFDAASRGRSMSGRLSVPELSVASLAASPTGTTMAMGVGNIAPDGITGSSAVALFNPAGNLPLSAKTLSLSEGQVSCIAVSSDGMTIAVGYGGGIVLLNAENLQRRRREPLPVPEGYVTELAMSFDSRLLAALFSSNEATGVILFDLMTGQRLASAPISRTRCEPQSLALSTDGKRLAVQCYNFGRRINGGFMLFGTEPLTELGRDALRLQKRDIQSLRLSPDLKVLACGVAATQNRQGTLELFNPQTGEPAGDAPLPGPTKITPSDLIFSPDGRTLAVAGSGDPGTIMFWDTNCRRWRTPTPLVLSKPIDGNLVFSGDGKTLAVPDRGGVTVLAAGVWQPHLTGRYLVAEGLVTSVELDKEGKFLAVTYQKDGGDSGLVLISLKDRARLVSDPLLVLKGGIQRLIFARAGSRLIAKSFGASTGAFVLDLSLASWRRQAERIANRSLSPEERRQFLSDEP